MSTEVLVDSAGLEQRVVEFYGTVADLAVDAMFTEMRTSDDTPRDTGAMTANLEVTNQDSDPELVRLLHAPEPYSSWQDEGTGIYGPTGERIFPTNAPLLVFFWKKTGKVEFMRSVAGTPKTEWWTKVVTRWVEFLQGALR